MSVKMLRLSVCVKHLSGWSKNVQFSRNFASRSGKLSADATAAAAASISQRKIELKEPIGTEKLQNYFDSEIKNGDIVPVFKRALLFGNKIAIKDSTGEYTYRQILEAAHKFSHELSAHSYVSANETKVAFLCPNTAIYTVVQWACWISGQIALPLSSKHPVELLKYYVEDSDAQVIVTTPEYEDKMKSVAEALGRKVICLDHRCIPNEADFNPNEDYNVIDVNNQFSTGQFYRNSNALILYTSGSTGLPKGTVISHKNIQSQTMCLTQVWQINARDNILHVLPLNHVHGSVNALLCPLSVGAKVIMHEKFDPSAVWSKLLHVNTPTKYRISVFMAVPTIYSFLIAEYEKAFGKNDRMVEYIREFCEKNIRLMISGSAPLPTQVFNRWQRITSHKLLERYGMTETGMILSNPYYMDASRDRIPGTVGGVLPETTVRLVNDKRVLCEVKGEYGKGLWSPPTTTDFKLKTPQRVSPTVEANKHSANTTDENIVGELYVKGPSIFVEYYKKPEETKNTFEDGWFKTGDVAKYENGLFKILGRSNVDIIKTGAYKVSALEIETHLLEHPSIADVCVVGVPDPTWGQKIAALIVCKENETESVTLPKLRAWCEERIASYQIPSIIKILDEIPRNAMGKFNKKQIVRDFFAEKNEV